MSEIYHKENPFLDEIYKVVIPVTKRKRLRAVIMDSSTGQLISDATGYNVVTTKEHLFPGYQDIQPYVKLYANQVSFLRRISIPAIHVFSYIIENLKCKQTNIVLEPTILAKELNYKTDRSIYNGILDLVKEKVIARAYTGKRATPTYWINPTFFYNGNRQNLLADKSTGE